MRIFPNFSTAIEYMIDFVLNQGYKIHPQNWQGLEVTHKPEAEMIENLNLCFQVPLPGQDLSALTKEISPDLDWANEHFEERVSGIPYNPPPSSSTWKYAQADNKDFKKNEIFDHTYPERFWPKDANFLAADQTRRMGIRYAYGDLEDVIKLLGRDPTTRQAFLPIFFPEDTGSVNNIRVPCTLGYHFIMRGNHLHVTYFIRSMDILRHARNDFYLTARLLYWVLEQLRCNYDAWRPVRPGLFTLHCVSAHCFVGDQIALKKQLP